MSVSATPTGESEVRRLRTLYQLVSTLSRATALEEVYQAAITALLEATGADRASILLFDDDGVIRFKAWRGLSETYRTAVTGHTPWSKGIRDAVPIIIPDVLADQSMEGYQATFIHEGIRALAFIPLALEAGVFGKFMLYYSVPHEFPADEVEAAQAIATHVAFAADRKRAELARARSEQRLQGILDNSGTVIYLKDTEGRYTLINRLHQDLFHLTNDEVVGRSDYDLFPREIAERLIENDRLVLETGRSLTIEEHVPQDDGVHSYISVKFPIQEPDGAITGICGISTDITQRKKAEAAARRLAAIVENSWEAIIGIDLTGTITSWNKSAERLFGYTAAEAVGQPLATLASPTCPNDNREIRERVLRGETIKDHETQRKRKDGRLIDISLTASPVRNQKGEIVGASGVAHDITERRRTEERLRQSSEALRESEDHYRHTVELDPQVPWTSGVDGRLEDFSPQWLKLTGLTREQALTTGWNDVPHPDDLPAMLHAWSHSMQTGEMLDLEHRIRVADGTYRWMRTRARPRRDAAGSILRWYGYTEDIDDRKRAELELQRAKQQMENILASIRESFIALDRQWRYTYVNERVLQRTQLSREQLMGGNIWELFPESATLFREPFERCMEGRVPVHFEGVYPIWRGESTPRHYETHAYPTQEGICVYIRDITVRKRAEEAARQLAGIVEATSDFVAIARLDGPLVYLNRAGRSMLGIAADAEIKDLTIHSVCSPDVLSNLHDGVASREGALLARSGEEIPASFVFVVHPDADGKPPEVSIIARDITERKATEDALRKANSELEEFAYVASHDLQEPLRTVNIYTQLLLRHVSDSDTRAGEYGGFIREGVQRMDSLVRDLLSYSRVIHSEPDHAPVADLADACDQALRGLKARIDETSARVEVAPLPQVRGDAAHLAQVFQNLLSNSLKYQRPGTAPQVWISAESRGDEWMIAVRDNGIGFEQQYAQRIFRLFQRLHRDEYDGTGLGLAICQRIVERNGGRMWAESTPGEGASFFFTLPKVE